MCAGACGDGGKRHGGVCGRGGQAHPHKAVLACAAGGKRGAAADAHPVQEAAALLETKNICPRTLAVMHAEDALQAFAQQFTQAKIFDVWVEI